MASPAYIPLTDKDPYLPSAPSASLLPPPPYSEEEQPIYASSGFPSPSLLSTSSHVPFAIPLSSPPFASPTTVFQFAPSPSVPSSFPLPPAPSLPSPDISPPSRRGCKWPEWSSATWCFWFFAFILAVILTAVLISEAIRTLHFTLPFKSFCTSASEWNSNMCLLSVGTALPRGIVVISQVGFGLVFVGQVGVGLLFSFGMASAGFGYTAGMLSFGGYVHFAMLALATYRTRFAMLGVQLFYAFFHRSSNNNNVRHQHQQRAFFVSCFRFPSLHRESEPVRVSSDAASYFANYHPQRWFQVSAAQPHEPPLQHQQVLVWQQQQPVFVQPPQYQSHV